MNVVPGKKTGYAKLEESGASGTTNSGGSDEQLSEQRNSLSEPLAVAVSEPDSVPITILSQNGDKHKINVNLTWSVARLKDLVAAEAGVEKILQRLIYHGRILDDSKTLEDYKIKSGCTVHLFARLRSSLVSLTAPTTSPTANGTMGGPVPLVLPADINIMMQQAAFRELQGGPQGGHDMFANMQLAHYARRVKLWSSLLLIWSTMQFFNKLVLLADPNAANRGRVGADDDFHHDDAHSPNHQMRPHITPLENTVDIFVDIIGIYVGIAGLKASTRLSPQLGQRYHGGLVALLVLWAAAGVVRLAEAHKQGILTSPSNLMMGVIILIGLPTLMWSFCVTQAAQFRRLIEATEQANRQQQQSEAAMRQALENA